MFKAPDMWNEYESLHELAKKINGDPPYICDMENLV